MSTSITSNDNAPKPVTGRMLIEAAAIAAVAAIVFYALFAWLSQPSSQPGSYFYNCGFVAGLAKVVIPMALSGGIALGAFHLFTQTARRAFACVFALMFSLAVIGLPSLGVTVLTTLC